MSKKGEKKMSSKIEQIIDEIEDYIDSCHFQPLSSTKIVVNKEYIEELLAELKMKTPDEIKKYNKIISNRDAILEEAKNRAESMLAEAHAQTSELVSEHEIMQQAYIQANEVVQKATEHAQEILDRATEDANNIRVGAMQYLDDSLQNLENIISHSIDNFGSRYDILMNSMKQSLDVVVANRKELHPSEEEKTMLDKLEQEAEEDANFAKDEEYTIPE